jgi:hypothetical protein
MKTLELVGIIAGVLFVVGLTAYLVLRNHKPMPSYAKLS